MGEDTVRADNSFGIEPVEYVLAVLSSEHLDRQVKIQMKAGGANEIRAFSLAEDEGFVLRAFDEIYRDDGERGTARMVQRPHFVIDR